MSYKFEGKEGDKCPQCAYPLVRQKNLLVCKNCKLFIHDGDMFLPNFGAIVKGKKQVIN